MHGWVWDRRGKWHIHPRLPNQNKRIQICWWGVKRVNQSVLEESNLFFPLTFFKNSKFTRKTGNSVKTRNMIRILNSKDLTLEKRDLIETFGGNICLGRRERFKAIFGRKRKSVSHFLFFARTL